MPLPVDRLNRALRENRPEDFLSSLHRQLAMRPLSFTPGSSLWEWEAEQDWILNPFGYVSGGYLTVFADEILGSAIGSLLNEGELAVTAELKISFLKPAAKGLIQGEGKVLHRGKNAAFVEAVVKDAGGETLAVISSTWIITSR